MEENSDVLISSAEIVKDKLYFATLAEGYVPKSTKNSKYFNIEKDIVYESFYFDFGPYHLCHLYQFCNKLNAELAKAPKSKKIVFYTSNNATLRLNAAYLIGCYAIIYLNKTPASINAILMECGDWELLRFRDASGGPPLFEISLLDCFQGLHVALQAGFFDFEQFDDDEYLFYEKVENGDLNWIIPGKMLAFSGPHAHSGHDRGYPLHSPEHYHGYFKDHNVSTIVRLNKKSYDARQFTAHGFEHKDLFFLDGSVPTEAIVNRFIRISEAAPGAVAVHCKAGLGRTGTLIACYMMKHYGFTARQSIAWLRICRPGSVIGHQQRFLEIMQPKMLAEGEAMRRRAGVTSLPRVACGVYSVLVSHQDVKENDTTVKPTPVSLYTILNDVENVAGHTASDKKVKKLDNNGNSNEPCDTENNLTKLRSQSPTTKTLANKNYMQPTSSIRNAANTNLNVKTQQNRLLNSTLKSHYGNKTSTFPPSRSSNHILANKMATGLKGNFGKNSFHGQRANLARNQNYALNTGGALRNLSRKTKLDDNNSTSSLTNMQFTTTSALTALTENCNLDGRANVPEMVTIKTITSPQPTRIPNPTNVRKKSIVRSNSNTRNRLSKNNNSNGNKLSSDNGDRSGTSLDSSCDTIATNISTDSLESPINSSPERYSRKRDKSESPEPIDFIHRRVNTDVRTETYDESLDTQGNKLYKIKALRRRYPGFGGILGSKKEGIQTRSSGSFLPVASSVKKK